ncbi:MAG: DUF3786 domain-containing protein [Spirochaetaceae bacterium]|jgi:hypothetical protein|nr:DUF3786 domain-containing protein [Spirochaetaceae bacterium]
MQRPNQRRTDWKDQADRHYSELYSGLDPYQVAERCKLPFDGSAFSLRLMGVRYRAAFPRFELLEAAEPPEAEMPVEDESVRVLVLRYLCQGRWAAPGGRQLSYSEIPWGALYFRNFEGRCIKRIERIFGNDPEGFSKLFEKHKNLKGGRLSGKEHGWRFEFLNDLFMSIIVWEGDDEFPSKAQILFDDNFPAAFSAEDIAVAGDICISRLKALKDNT